MSIAARILCVAHGHASISVLCLWMQLLAPSCKTCLLIIEVLAFHREI